MVFAISVDPVVSLIAHQNKPLNKKLKAIQTSDQFSASLTPMSCAPCFLSTTKSTNSDTSTMPTKVAHSQRGAIVCMEGLTASKLEISHPVGRRAGTAGDKARAHGAQV